MTTGAKIRYYRSMRGIAVSELAMRLEVEPALVTMWESDQMEPSAGEIERLCGVLGVAPAALYATEEGSASPYTGSAQQPSYGYVPPYYTPAPPPMPSKTRVWKGIALALFICSLMSIFLGVIVGESISYSGGTAVAVLISYGVVSLIPAASVVVGIIMCAKGIPNVKNIVAGAIAFCFVLLFGGVAFMDATDRDAAVPEDFPAVEAALGIDFPKHDSLDLYEVGEDTVMDVYFSRAEADALYDMVISDSRFMPECPTALVGMLPEATYLYHDAYLIYCVETASFNALPAERGEYSCICVCYNAESDMLEVSQYTVTFIPY